VKPGSQMGSRKTGTHHVIVICKERCVLSNTQILLLAGSDSFQRIRPGQARAQCMTGRLPIFPFPTGCRVRLPSKP
jgi:hypothetical protein